MPNTKNTYKTPNKAKKIIIETYMHKEDIETLNSIANRHQIGRAALVRKYVLEGMQHELSMERVKRRALGAVDNGSRGEG